MAEEKAVNLRMLTGRQPDQDNWFFGAVAPKWHERYIADGYDYKPHAFEGTPFRASMAGECSRKLAYYFANAGQTDPTNISDAWRFTMGRLIHEELQAGIMEAFPGSEIEVKVRIGGVGSGHMDLRVLRANEDGEPIITAVELKSRGATGFRSMILGMGSRTNPKPPEGPSWSYISQGSICAASPPDDVLPDELLIAVISPENLGKSNFRDPVRLFSAQWTFTQAEFMAVAEYEIQRVEKIWEIVQERGPSGVRRIIPDPKMPRHVITQPWNGTYAILNDQDQGIGTGHAWQCDYCPYQTQCSEDRNNGQ